jgi:DNA-binding SARP family transcriptional activator/tetratricopeptide (TPR) repeat protein
MWFGLLGQLCVRGDDGVELSVAGPRQRVMLAALLMRACQTVPTRDLADLLWEGTPPDSAPVTLRSYVKRLRRRLGAGGSRIVTRNNGYLIEVSGDELDLSCFAELCRTGITAGRAARWDETSGLLTEALTLWRSVPFEDIPSERLIRTEAARLEEVRLEALEWRIEADLRRSRPEQLVGELQVLTTEHPLRERFHAQLMLSLYQSGRQAEALAAYQRVRGILVEELGIEPSSDLQDAHQRILNGSLELTADPPPVDQDWVARGRPHQLPAGIRHFAGRSNELETLTQLLHQAGNGRTVVISAIGGTAGVGKTALALHWAHEIAELFPDGQLYVNLRGYDPAGTPVEPGQAIRILLDSLSVPISRIPVSLEAQAALYRSLLAGRRMLVVLDNARDAQHARPLLPGSASCLVVVTSRSQLAGLVATEGAQLLNLGLMTKAEASELLVRHLGPQRVTAGQGALGELIRLCAGLPLALSIVAARAAARPGLPLAALTAELRDDQALLDALEAGDAGASVRAVFSWSNQNLTDPAARMFRLLGVHPGPDISAVAAAKLADTSPRQTSRILNELTSVHILTEHLAGRFSFHDLLRAYAIEEGRARDSDSDRQAALRRVLDYYMHTAYEAALLLNPARDMLVGTPFADAAPAQISDYKDATAWFESEHDVLLAVIAAAAKEGVDDHVGRIAWSLADYLDRRGNWHDWAAIQRLAVTSARSAGDQAAQARAYRGLGRAYTQLRAYRDALDPLERAVDLYGQLGDTVGEGRTQLALSQLCEYRDQPLLALRHARKALRLFAAAGHPPGEASALNFVGWHQAHLGNHRQALIDCRHALALYHQLGDRRGEGVTNDSLGYAYHHVGDHAQARRCYRNAVELFRGIGDRYNEASSLSRLGDAHIDAGESTMAVNAWQDALAILSSLDHPDVEEMRAKLRSHGVLWKHDTHRSAHPPGGVGVAAPTRRCRA